MENYALKNINRIPKFPFTWISGGQNSYINLNVVHSCFPAEVSNICCCCSIDL
jgi:hypothetical protein